MEYVKVVGKDYQEALFEARRKYGSNIMPLSDRKIKVGGILGGKLFGKVQVELTAAITERDQNKVGWLNKKTKSDPPKLDTSQVKWQEKVSPQPSSVKNESLQGDTATVNALETLLKAQSGKIESKKAPEKTQAQMDKYDSVLAQAESAQKKSSSQIEINPDYDKILKNVSDIKNMLNEIQKKEGRSLHGGRYYDTPLDRWEQKLLEADFSPEYADHIISEIREKLTVEEMGDREAIRKKLLLSLKNRVGIAPPLMKTSEKRKIAAFLGPTGVGKTTTLAKLGAIYTIYHNKKVAFITVDNYRIAATEQLKRYAEIISLPTHVVTHPEQLQKTIAQEDADLILIDTSGRSPYNESHLRDIDLLFSQVQEPVDKILISSAAAKRTDQQVIFENFSRMGIDKVIFTKLDESTSIGGLVETADKYNRGVSYITFGQDVPSDIEEAKAQKLAYLALGDRKRPLTPAEEDASV